jgi:chromate transporter
MALSYVYAGWGHVGAIAALFFGLKAAVLAVVLQAVVRVGSRALKNRAMLGIAAVAFVCIFFLGVPFPAIIIAAGLLGWLGTRAGSPLFQIGGGHGAGGKGVAEADSLLREDAPAHTRVIASAAWRAALVWGVLWLAPVAVLLLTLGTDNTFSRIALFFTEMAIVTFGGAYAVLAYVAQQAVEHYHWLRPGEMLDGLGMAETTPGPLIMVTQFVGFMAAYRDPGALHPMVAGTLGGLLTTWVTFTPCFLWIFLGAPFIERLRGNKALSGALAAITAAVVGVILNLAVWFALHTWFRETRPVHAMGLGFDAPVPASLDPWALALSAAAMIAVFRFKVGMIPTLLTCSVVGIVLHLAGVV